MIITCFCLQFFSVSLAEDQIISSPLINIDELKPSFGEEEIIDDKIDDTNIVFKQKGVNEIEKIIFNCLWGLDKITAKTSEIKIKL